MIRSIDASLDLPEQTFDICIIGAGPVGVTLCSELSDANFKICVLESGGPKKTKLGDKLRAVYSKGIVIKDHSRERVIGGASSTWSALSAPLDHIDMEPRNFLNVPSWPISYEELIPYWERTAKKYRFPRGAAFEEFKSLREGGDLKAAWRDLSEKVFLAPSEPQRFGKEFQEVFNRKNVDLFYGATVTRIVPLDEDVKTVGHVCVRSGEKEFRIQAHNFILAGGGIENARLLLASNLGNEYDQAGRYFMNHPKNSYGVITLRTPVRDAEYFLGCLWNGFTGYAGIRLSEDIQRNWKILNSYVRFEPLYPWSHNAGVMGSIFIVKRLKSLVKAWKKIKSKEVVPLRDYAETGDDSGFENLSIKGWLTLWKNIITNLPVVFLYGYYRLSSRKPEVRRLQIRNFMEMEPRSENRVILGDERNLYGQQIPIVQHDTSALDRRSLIELHKSLIQEFKNLGLGEVQTDLESMSAWPIDQDASHHLGTTRMGKDPRTSVVNENLQVHSMNNLYCAGGSVFSTSGCANPTFTMCALAIRLADHLKQTV